MIRNIRHYFFILLLLCSVSCVEFCYAENTYLVTETELKTLENQLQILDKNNTKLQKNWNEQQRRIENALTSSRKTEKQLELAEKQLDQFAKEQKRLKREKDIWEYTAVAIAVMALLKK